MKVLEIDGLMSSSSEADLEREKGRLLIWNVRSIIKFLQGKTQRKANGSELKNEITRIENELSTSSIVVK